MSLFGRRHFKELERLSPEEARQRRLISELSRQREALEAQSPRLSQANVQHSQLLKAHEDRLRDELRRQAEFLQRTADVRGKSSRNFTRAMSGFLQLEREHRRAQQRRQLSEAAERLRQASAADRSSGLKSFYRNPRSVFGTEARIGYFRFQKLFHKGFAHALTALPCIQREVRREVMFAKRKAGKGYRVPHSGKFMNVWC